MVAAAAAKGDVFLRYTDWEAVRTVGEVLLQSGARVRLYPEGIPRPLQQAAAPV